MNKEVLTAFCISRGGEVADLATFEGGIGCPRGSVVYNMLHDAEVSEQFTPFIRRLESYATDVDSFINLSSIACIIGGESKPSSSAMEQLLSFMIHFPSTYRDSALAMLEDFVRFVARCKCSESIELSERSSELLIQLLMVECSHETPTLVPICMTVCREHASDTQIQLRFASMFCVVAGRSDALFATCSAAGCMGVVSEMCHSADVLIQILMVEALEHLMKCPLGLQHLAASGEIRWLLQESCSPDSMLGNYALRTASTYFSELGGGARGPSDRSAEHEPQPAWLSELWASIKTDLAPEFITSVLKHIETNSEASRLAAVAAVTSFASSSLDILEAVVTGASSGESASFPPRVKGLYAQIMNDWIGLLGSKVEMQAVVLNSVATLIRTTDRLCVTEEDYARHAQAILMLLRRIGDFKKAPTMTYLLKLAQQPLPEVKFGAFTCFISLASINKGWGLDILLSHHEFIDHFSTHGTEYGYETRERKFQVIEAILRNPHSAVVADAVLGRLRKAFVQGPHFRPAVVDVAAMEK